MSDPRMIPADEAKQLREGITPGRWKLNEWESVVGLTIEYWNESAMEVANVKLAEAAPDLAHTVVEQAAQIERVREALHRIEQADEQAQHDWDTNYNPDSQHEALAYSMAAQWLEEALGDTDD